MLQVWEIRIDNFGIRKGKFHQLNRNMGGEKNWVSLKKNLSSKFRLETVAAQKTNKKGRVAFCWK